ncbi:MAG TPA: flagellar accessory protein FlaH [Dehalococcoidia bacterium]|nr:flagellar accessory protein FlaH [Dehalococcoidia bacterium]
MEKLEKKDIGLISTGNDELDKKIGGGIPPNSLSLIEGQPDSGKSVLSQQMIWGSLRNGYKVAIFTTENSVRSLLTQMQSLNLDVTNYLLLSRLQIFPVDARKTAGNLNTGLAPMVANCALRGFDLAVIDSLTYYVTHVGVAELITFFEEMKALNGKGLSVLCSAHSYAFEEGTLIRIGAMCDAHLRLRMETMGAKLIKILEVAKVRGAVQKTGNIVSFDVEPNWGIKVIPYSKARA